MPLPICHAHTHPTKTQHTHTYLNENKQARHTFFAASLAHPEKRKEGPYILFKPPTHLGAIPTKQNTYVDRFTHSLITHTCKKKKKTTLKKRKEKSTYI
jgi:hypothetical protein